MEPIGSLIEGRETAVVAPASTVREAAELMSARGIGAVPVVDADRVVGIFTERDIMSRVVAAGRDPAKTTVGDVMSTALVVADVAESRDACLQRLQAARVRHLLVLKSGRLIGIVSLRDLVAREIREKDHTIDMLNAYIHYIPADVAPRNH